MLPNPECPVCHGEGWITVQAGRGNRDPEWETDVPCSCMVDDDGYDPLDDVNYPEGPSRPGDPDWADPWDR